MATKDELAAIEKFYEANSRAPQVDKRDFWVYGEFLKKSGDLVFIENWRVSATNAVVAQVLLWKHALESYGSELDCVWDGAWEVRDEFGEVIG